MEVLQGSRKNRKSNSLYKIGDLANISKISLQNNGSFLDTTKKIERRRRHETEERGAKTIKTKKGSGFRPAAADVFFISSSYSIGKKEKNLKKGSETRVPSLQCHLLKFQRFPDLLPAVRRRNEGRGRRRPRRPSACGRGFLHLCSPLSLQRGKNGWRGNSRPSRAAPSRIHTGRFCI